MSARRRLIAIAACAGALAGCRAIADYYELDYQPASSTTCAPLVLPASGTGRIRLVNAGTEGTFGASSDFCIRVSGASAWEPPLFAGSGPACRSELSYAKATVPFNVPSGTIDVEAIEPGSSCTDHASSIATSIAVGDFTLGSPVVTIVRMGGGALEQIVAHPEESATIKGGAAGSLVRVMNALSGTPSINVGLTASPTLPQSIGAPLFPASIAPGGVEPAGATTIGAVDAQGYANIESFGADIGLVFANETSAFAAFQTPAGVGVRTIFAIGDPTANAHPVRGLVCDESASIAAIPDASAFSGGVLPPSLLAPCTLTTLPTLVIDTVNASLYGGNAPFEDERRSAVIAKIAARPADVMCVVEAYGDRAAIASAAIAAFPYSYEIETDETTPAADPSLLDGGAPLVPTVAPCSGINATALQNIYACVAKSCSTTGDLSGTLALTDHCLGSACAVPFSKIFLQSPQSNLCFDCTIDHLTSFETLSHAEGACNTDTRPPFVFGGQASAMILSRYPLTNTSAVVLPSTNLRREVLYAEVELEDGPLDFYCAPLDPQYIDADEPYEGPYGEDETTTLPDGGEQIENGWEDEQGVQVTRLVSFVKKTSGATKHAAVVAGEWYSGVQVKGAAGANVVVDEAPEVTRALDDRFGGAFVRADPTGYAPSCDQCPAPTNPYNAGVQPVDDSATYLFQFPADSTTEETLWGTESDVPLKGSAYQPAPAGGMGPAFEYYPREVRVIRPRTR